MIKKLFRFFFPDDNRLKIEAITSVGYDENGRVKINREFFTFRALIQHFWGEIYREPIRAFRELLRLDPYFSIRGGITFDTSSTFSSDNCSSSFSYSHTCSGSNRVLVAYAGAAAAHWNWLNMSYGGISLNRVHGVDISSGSLVMTGFVLANPPSGSNTIVFDENPYSFCYPQICAVSFSGANQLSPIDVTGSNQGTDAVAQSPHIINIATTYNDEYIFSADSAKKYSASSDIWAAVGSGQTQIMNNRSPSTGSSYTRFIASIKYKDIAGSDTQRFNWSGGSNPNNNWGMLTMTICSMPLAMVARRSLIMSM